MYEYFSLYKEICFLPCLKTPKFLTLDRDIIYFSNVEKKEFKFHGKLGMMDISKLETPAT